MVIRTSSGRLAWMLCAWLPGWLTGKVPEDKGNGKGEADKREAKGQSKGEPKCQAPSKGKGQPIRTFCSHIRFAFAFVFRSRFALRMSASQALRSTSCACSCCINCPRNILNHSSQDNATKNATRKNTWIGIVRVRIWWTASHKLVSSSFGGASKELCLHM